MEIEFYNEENVAMPRLREDDLRQWIAEVVRRYDKEVGVLTYFFCSDPYILEANRQFLQHDYYTDIITFDNTAEGVLNGDLLISLETVQSNAEGLGESLERELHRVIIHGVLHMLGLEDHSPEEDKKMRAAEDEALAILNEQLGEGTPLLLEAYHYHKL